MFAHEKLIVYRKTIEFVAWIQPHIEALPRVAVRDQLDRASAVECAACLDVAVARHLVDGEAVAFGKSLLEEIVRMLATMLDRLGYRFDEETARVREDEAVEG